MELKEYVQILVRRWYVAVIVFAVFAGAAAFTYVEQAPQFRATALVTYTVDVPPKVLQAIDLKQYYDTGYNFWTKEALIRTRRMTEFATAVYLCAKEEDVGEIPKDNDDLLRLLHKKGYLAPAEGGYSLVKEKVHDHWPGFGARISTTTAPDKVQILTVTARGDDRDDAILRANSFGRGAEAASLLMSRERIGLSAKNIRERMEEIAGEMSAPAWRWLDEEKVEDRQYEVEALRSAIAQHERQIEGIAAEKGRVKTRIDSLATDQHLEHAPVPKFRERNLESPLMNRIRQDKVSTESNLKLKGKFHWTESHPDFQELGEKLSWLEGQEFVEASRLRVAELTRLKDLEAEIRDQEIYHQLLRSEKVNRLLETKAWLRQDLPRLKEYQKLEEEKARLERVARQLDTVSGLQEPFFKLYEQADTQTSAPIPASHRNVLLLAAFGLLVSLACAFVAEFWDTSIYSDYDVRRYLNLGCIGVVERQPRGESPLVMHQAARSLLAERFNMAATVLRTYMVEQEHKTVLVSSAIPREGKTTVATNFALSMARKGLRVVLVDTDMRLPQVHEVFGLPMAPGLSGHLRRALDGKPVDALALLQETYEPNLKVVSAGPTPDSPIELLESQAMLDFISAIRGQSDVVVFDTPPVMDVSDTLSLATRVDTCVLVVASGSDRRRASWAKQLLTNVRVNLAGVLLNFVRPQRGRGSYYYYYYGYGYGGGKSKTLREV